MNMKKSIDLYAYRLTGLIDTIEFRAPDHEVAVMVLQLLGYGRGVATVPDASGHYEEIAGGHINGESVNWMIRPSLALDMLRRKDEIVLALQMFSVIGEQKAAINLANHAKDLADRIQGITRPTGLIEDVGGMGHTQYRTITQPQSKEQE